MILQRKSIPTGDPTCPLEVEQAKIIKYKLGQKADLGDATGPFHLENGFEDSSLLEEDDAPIATVKKVKRKKTDVQCNDVDFYIGQKLEKSSFSQKLFFS